MMKLYIYEHCPFCVMTKMIFALKQYPIEIAYLSYDDVQTPMQMVGRKLLPVLEYDQGAFMPESWEIIQHVDEIVGSKRITLPKNRSIEEWIEKLQRFIYRLAYPRWIRAPFPEFNSEEAKKYFYKSKDPSGKGFVSDLSDPALIQRAQNNVDGLEDLLNNYPTLNQERMLSLTDFSLFAQLHSLSIIKGINYGPTVDHWRKTAAEICYIPLCDEYAN